MTALQASSSYGGAFTVSIATPPAPSRQPRTILAKVEQADRSVEIMRKFSVLGNRALNSALIKGLAEHRDTLGAPLCPCRHYDDKPAEAQQGFWNCPCVPMRERKKCHCMLFLTPDNLLAKSRWGRPLLRDQRNYSKYVSKGER